ncbi:MAG: hypothetical protein OEZ43_07780 [Gammaproteobacteria bacterium]|nr:hypothetical protein [Gammaproteobacteria bacterium]
MTRIIKHLRLNQNAVGNQASTICEPSLATSGKRIIVSGNWFCARSSNMGKSWKFIDPYETLPPARGGVCCDQIVHYSKKWRLWFWLTQYRKTSEGNLFRVAVSNSGTPTSWTWWDTKPTDINASWTDVWFDYPDILETENYLLFSFNMFTVSGDVWTRAVVIRLPLKDLKARASLPRQAWSTTQYGSLRFARGEGDSAYFASQSNRSTAIVMFKWADNSTSVTHKTITVSPWKDGPYDSLGPNNKPWLKRLDDRITAGWRARGLIGFAWSASADDHHPHPYIRCVRINEHDETLLDEPDLWSLDRAWSYPATCPNKRGDIGMTAFCGGGNDFACHAVGWLDESLSQWKMKTVKKSTHAPQNGAWGDYLDIQPDPSRKTYWVASGFVLDGGSSRAQIEPGVVYFAP